jgi:hypothetical protein
LTDDACYLLAPTGELVPLPSPRSVSPSVCPVSRESWFREVGEYLEEERRRPE